MEWMNAEMEVMKKTAQKVVHQVDFNAQGHNAAFSTVEFVTVGTIAGTWLLQTKYHALTIHVQAINSNADPDIALTLPTTVIKTLTALTKAMNQLLLVVIDNVQQVGLDAVIHLINAFVTHNVAMVI